ncbi:MAG: gamma carbonic anhydrase family protein [Gemmatimonadaceae bacterium]
MSQAPAGPSFVHPSAVILGDVRLGERVSVWPTAVIRAEYEPVTVGAESNVQDGVVIHVDAGFPATIGERVTIGHRAIVHGATVESECLVGMGAILLNGVRVGTGSVIGAGAVCRQGMQIPAHSLVLGVPAKVVRQTTEDERAGILRSAETYVSLAAGHREGRYPTLKT